MHGARSAHVASELFATDFKILELLQWHGQCTVHDFREFVFFWPEGDVSTAELRRGAKLSTCQAVCGFDYTKLT